jgi:hypothetical protein
MQSGQPPGDSRSEMPDLPSQVARLRQIQRGPDLTNAFPGQTRLAPGLQNPGTSGSVGRLDGSGVTSPCRARQRLTVAGDTFAWWSCFRCQAMVRGPASGPSPASSSRSRVISSTVPGAVTLGEFFGRRDRGSNAASPSASQRASSVQIHDRATPYEQATSVTGRFSTVTAVMTSRAQDIPAANRL